MPVGRVFTSTYHDTEDRRLTRAGMALRRRVENGKSTWELELPESRGEVALAAPGGPAEPPALVADLLRAVLRGRRLSPVATLQTRRSDDAHEDVELLEGHRVVERFENGKDPKLPELDPRRVARPKPADGAIAHVQAMLRRQVDEIVAHDPGTRLGDDPESLHKFRVAVRRSRAVLRAARPLLDEQPAEKLRAELRWLGQALGRVRDLDVLLEELREQARRLPADDAAAVGPVLAALEDDRAAARDALLETLASERYLALLSRLEQAAEAPLASSRKRKLDRIAKSQFGKLERALRELGREPDDAALHRIRVLTKRARYTAELAEAAMGKRARRIVKRARKVQDVLGGHQDAVVAEERLRAAARQARGTGAAIAVGRLVERQEARKARARDQFPKARRKLERAGRKAFA